MAAVCSLRPSHEPIRRKARCQGPRRKSVYVLFEAFRFTTDSNTTQEHPDDVNRATSLMALYEIREKLKQQDSMGLQKAREKIMALEAKRQAQAAAEKKVGGEGRQSPYTFPKPTQS
jgi:hypothetical protein